MNDFYADSILAAIFKAELESSKSAGSRDNLINLESSKFEENLIAALNDMFEASSIEYRAHDSIAINLDSKTVSIDLQTCAAKCEEDEHLEQIVTTVIKQLKSLSWANEIKAKFWVKNFKKFLF